MQPANGKTNELTKLLCGKAGKLVDVDRVTDHLLDRLIDKHGLMGAAEKIGCDRGTLPRYKDRKCTQETPQLMLKTIFNIRRAYAEETPGLVRWPAVIQAHLIIISQAIHAKDNKPIESLVRNPIYVAIASVLPEVLDNEPDRILMQAGWHFILAHLRGRHAKAILATAGKPERREGYDKLNAAIRHLEICSKFLKECNAPRELQAHARSQQAVFLTYGREVYREEDRYLTPGVSPEEFAIHYNYQDLMDRVIILKNRPKYHPEMWNAAKNLFEAASAKENLKGIKYAWGRLCKADPGFKMHGPTYVPSDWVGKPLAADAAMAWGCDKILSLYFPTGEPPTEEKPMGKDQNDFFMAQVLTKGDRPIVTLGSAIT